MKERKVKIAVLVAAILAVLLIVSAAVYFGIRSMNFYYGDITIPRSSTEADLREYDLTVDDYCAITAELPQCHILWMIPIGSERYDCTAESIVVDSVKAEDIPLYSYFDDLRRVDAADATCYLELKELQQALPNCTVDWAVHMGMKAFSPATQQLQLDGSGVTCEELTEKLSLFPDLKSVELTEFLLSGAEKTALLERYPAVSFVWTVEVSGKSVLNTVTELSFSGQPVDAASLVAAAEFLPDVTSLDLVGSGCSVEELLAIRDAYGCEISADLSLYGVEFDTGVTELYFNDIPMESVDAVEQILPLLPKLTKVEMCNCGIPSEEMDALWKRNPQVRFIWTVKIGRATLRTDCTSFIGAKHGYLADAKIADPWKDKHNRLFDEDCVEFKYCVDMVCLDLGHMGITDYSFISYMPKLRYLILADTHGTDFSPLAGLEELVFLELFLTKFNQTEILLTLPKLEDLNIAFTQVDDTQYLQQMTWLKRLWMSYSKVSYKECEALSKQLPDTQVDYTAAHSTANGWRTGYLYFEMRDYLGMYYLD